MSRAAPASLLNPPPNPRTSAPTSRARAMVMRFGAAGGAARAGGAPPGAGLAGGAGEGNGDALRCGGGCRRCGCATAGRGARGRRGWRRTGGDGQDRSESYEPNTTHLTAPRLRVQSLDALAGDHMLPGDLRPILTL